ncbi:MAG: hypothetical protein LBM04_01660 [Opitutaceae bacterium]|jgi:hypothetical protein|nr:hypothetical protein [Opitutaceae bacterium]
MNGAANETPMDANETPVNEKPPAFDFPTWLPPMLVKELRQGLRARGFMFSLIGLHAMLVIAFGWSLILQYLDGSAGIGMVDGFFWALTFAMLVLVMPLRGLSGLNSEIETRNVDLLMLTQLTSWRIVWGKWTSLVTQSALLLVTLLPYGVMRYFFGGVDLLQDLAVFMWLFVTGAVATALMLWVSGLPRLLRVVLVITLVVVFNMLLGSLFRSLMRHGFASTFGGAFLGGGSGVGIPSLVQLTWLFDMAIVLVFFLLQAVRRISPPSENHSLTTRLIAFAVFLPAPFLMFFHNASRGVKVAMEIQAVAGLVVFMLVCVLELATVELPMPVHVRRIRGRGGRGGWARRALCLLFLPGWTGAAFFTLAGLALFAVLLLAGAFPSPEFQPKFLRVLGLAWIAVVLPSAVMSLFLKRGKTSPLIVYGLIQCTIGLLCMFGAFIADSSKLARGFRDAVEAVFHMLPVTGFWYEFDNATKSYQDLSAPVLFGQVVVCAFSIAFIAFCSRPFFRACKAGVKSIKPE